MNRAGFGPPGLLGKHPSRGDFLSLGNCGHEFTSLDAFFTQNVEWAEENAGSGWADAYRQGGVQAFVYRPISGGRAPLLVGALGPSSDRAGRRFPLSVAMPLWPPAKLLAAPEVLPLVVEPCWQLCSELVLSLTADPDANVAEQLVEMDVPGLELGDAFDSYSEWTRSLPVGELWTLVFGDERHVDPGRVLATVSDTVRSCSATEGTAARLSFRLPLGMAGGAAVCFWLDWVACVAGWKANMPTFFWSHDGHQGAMTLALGTPSRSTLAELWLPTGQSEEIWDVTRPDGDSPESEAARRLSARQISGATVADLLLAAHTLPR